MRDSAKRITPRQLNAIAALLTEPTISSAAKRTKISEATLWRWVQQEGFKDALEQAGGDAFKRTLEQLKQSSSEAVEVLHGVMKNPESKPSPRVAAARTTLEMTIRVTEFHELERRVAELEAKVKEEARKRASACISGRKDLSLLC